MTDRPPRLAIWLLEWLLPESDALTGDLIEEFETRRSRWWFWRQAAVGIVIASLQGPRDVRPLRLLDFEAGGATPFRTGGERRPVNLSASPLPHAGGLGLVALAGLVTAIAPYAWVILLAAMLSGALLGVIRIAVNRPGETSAGFSGLLFRTSETGRLRPQGPAGDA